MDNEVYQNISEKLNIPVEVVKLAYNSYWEFIRLKIVDLPLKEDEISEEDFNKLRTNFNIPSLGKLNCTYDKLLKTKRKFKYIRGLKNRSL